MSVGLPPLVPAGDPAADDLSPGKRSGFALCLSGGGYRASLFHLGAARRLYELGLLKRLDTISSVSGGSIFSAMLAVLAIERGWNDGLEITDFDVQEAQHLGGEQVGGGVHCGVSLPGMITTRQSGKAPRSASPAAWKGSLLSPPWRYSFGTSRSPKRLASKTYSLLARSSRGNRVGCVEPCLPGRQRPQQFDLIRGKTSDLAR